MICYKYKNTKYIFILIVYIIFNLDTSVGARVLCAENSITQSLRVLGQLGGLIFIKKLLLRDL